MSQKILIVVQARMSSGRLPGKVMLPLLGKSLLARMIERLQMSKYQPEIMIATSVNPDDDILEKEAKHIGVACFRGSLNNLLERHYLAAIRYGADIVLKIPSDCPLIDPRIVDHVLDFFFKNEGKYDYISNLHPATWPDGNDVEVMTMYCLEQTCRLATRALELEHTTPYIWENPDQFRIGNVVWATGKDYSMSHRFTIDYQEDYEFIKRVYEQLYFKKGCFSCEDIIDLLIQKPDIQQINAEYAGVNWYRHHLDELSTISARQTKIIHAQ
ncbi:cytidylyltransferase domain-containing protein [Mucilaginibacter ginsenosidivorans]|uniref:Acylneuraminate cytidylyltransferase n=1 Tax=Mucilaginibacter ginsenosidivorans TaxID=398053 RepID=A0A5B8V2Q0_9SPHI|nr:glycosyltransferase family protein [Mucilaginibacter ginsenosidivorans]QEC65429.1 acylneuraminate cytidylyltransferase [Mucilaginibacter ginsenosidivorans]